MKKVICLFVTMLSFATAYAEDCKRSGDVFEELNCARTVFFELDDKLNTTYNNLMKELDNDGKASLKKEQTAWIKDRNASCSHILENGEESIVISCAVKKTRERLNYLQDHYAELLQQQNTAAQKHKSQS